MSERKDQPIRVLQVLGGTNLGGAESRVMDLYRSMDRTRVQFDFAVHTAEKGFFDDEIRALGGNIYALPRFRGYNLPAYRRAWKLFFAEHPGYAFVHGHMTSTASVYLPAAKRAGVPVTAAHARSAGVDGGLKGVLTRLMRLPLWKRADYCLAASALAGEAVFGKKAVKQGKVIVLPNAIAASKYAYDPVKREKLRAELGVGDGLVLGHVGRFHPCKNHGFWSRCLRRCAHRSRTAICFFWARAAEWKRSGRRRGSWAQRTGCFFWETGRTCRTIIRRWICSYSRLFMKDFPARCWKRRRRGCPA